MIGWLEPLQGPCIFAVATLLYEMVVSDFHSQLIDVQDMIICWRAAQSFGYSGDDP